MISKLFSLLIQKELQYDSPLECVKKSIIKVIIEKKLLQFIIAIWFSDVYIFSQNIQADNQLQMQAIHFPCR